MLHKAQLCNTDFVAYNTTEKLIFLMNHINMQPIVASTMHDMFQRRKDVILKYQTVIILSRIYIFFLL